MKFTCVIDCRIYKHPILRTGCTSICVKFVNYLTENNFYTCFKKYNSVLQENSSYNYFKYKTSGFTEK